MHTDQPSVLVVPFLIALFFTHRLDELRTDGRKGGRESGKREREE